VHERLTPADYDRNISHFSFKIKVAIQTQEREVFIENLLVTSLKVINY